MFNRLLASIGIGAAQIDTLLEKTRYAPGETINGVVRIKGGSVEQRIEAISLSVMTEYLKESGDNKYYKHGEVARFHVSAPFMLQSGENREVPFSFVLPENTPLSIGRTPVWVKTELDIRGGVDPGDNDRIEVVPTPQIRTVFEALELLDFRLRKADCEHSYKHGGQLPFVQEFEFAPGGQFRGRLDELEVMFLGGSDGGLELLLQIDRRARGLSSFLSEALDMDESFVRIRLSGRELEAGPQGVAKLLADTIARYC
ncbi:sporulation protein [Paenibacillus sp. sptzw28]|uniref:sporulation protein n=1 Tax=Paenibacillus sp. sptzw28 TaxID=715179 RepID=UPI001C6F382A|nr:sporulation protein [Paenibacillus sp. sptzw28]QYR22979.1 sporulation protein [Paenibacillus sp. sptzw28]